MTELQASVNSKKYAVISMDVEDWYHTYFPEDDVDRSISLLDGLDVALKIMKKKNIRGSFFVVGEIADQLSDRLVKMDKAGHDIACHNWKHLRPLTYPLDEYKTQLIQAKDKLESILGHEIYGYRAPSFGTDDAHLNIVREVGFKYDASKLKPQKSAKYGVLNLDGFKQVRPCIYQKNGFTEFEVSTQKIGDFNMLLGGGYIRMLPWWFMERMTQKYLDTGKLYVMYIHPIDLSPKEVPRVEGESFDRYLRTHVGKKHMVWRFRKVIDMLEKSGYEFVTFKDLLDMYTAENNNRE